MGGVKCPAAYLYEDVRDTEDPRTGESAGYSAYASSTHTDDTQGEDYRAGPLVVRAEEPLEIFQQGGHSDFHAAQVDVQTLVSRHQPARPRRHTEADLTSDALQRLRLSNIPVADTTFVSHTIGGTEVPGYEVRQVFPLVACKLSNDNTDLRLTLADLQVVWREKDHEYRTRVLKTLWLNPGAAQLFHVWFGRPVDSAECRLLHARGQAAN
jgi:hypothetical protein